LWPGQSGIPRLDAFASIFELYRLASLRVEYRAAVGTTVNGMVHIGIDFDANDTPTTTAGVAGLNPVMSIPVWKDSQMSVPVDRANKAMWLYTGINPTGVTHPDLGKALACVIANSASQVIGEVWLNYEVEFSSPKIGGEAVQYQQLYTSQQGGSFRLADTPPIQQQSGNSGGASSSNNGLGSSLTLPPWPGGVLTPTLSPVTSWLRTLEEFTGLNPNTVYQFMQHVMSSDVIPSITGSALTATAGTITDLLSVTDTSPAWKQGCVTCLAVPDSSGNLTLQADWTADDPTATTFWYIDNVLASVGASQGIKAIAGFGEIH